jgi:hypothetical protein
MKNQGDSQYYDIRPQVVVFILGSILTILSYWFLNYKPTERLTKRTLKTRLRLKHLAEKIKKDESHNDSA